jgi:hypothetical protein
MDYDLICYQFSRPNVERGDFSHFLSLYGRSKLPTGRRLRQMMGTLVFAIDGYNDDPRELHVIPEVRRFYAAFHQAWPYWLYFCDLHQDGLKLLVFCCQSNFTTIKVDGKFNCATNYDPLELIRFLAADFMPMNDLCEQAGASERMIYDRSKAVFEYFGLPYAAEPTPPPGAP